MEMTLSATQAAVTDACTTILRRAAGPGRARELRRSKRTDDELLALLGEAGFLDVALEEESGPLTAVLLTELAARHLAVAPIGIRTLVGPAVITPDQLPRFVTIMDAASPAPVRYGVQSEALIVIDGHDARLVRASEYTATMVDSLFGYPLAAVELRERGVDLGPGTGDVARRWWRVAIAAEIAGTARAALDLTMDHLKGRSQFGKPLASHQALQHRVIECHVLIEGATWAAREAAYRGAPSELAGSAAVAAVEAAGRTLFEVHQLSGAIGFTDEYDLTLSSLRLQTLRTEAGGIAAHARALVESRWG